MKNKIKKIKEELKKKEFRRKVLCDGFTTFVAPETRFITIVNQIPRFITIHRKQKN